MTDELDNDIDDIIASIAEDVYDYAEEDDTSADEAVFSATISHRQAIQTLIERECNRARIAGVTYAKNSFQDFCNEEVHKQLDEYIAELQSNTDGDKK